MAKSKLEQVADQLTTPVPRVPVIPDEDFLSTGCTLLNLAVSGRPTCGVPKGTYLYIVGDSGSGKTWFTFNLFAEAARNEYFRKYRFVFDNAENGALMDVARYFGSSVEDRLEAPAYVKKKPKYSATVQEFYLNLEINCRKGPCIYVLDSMDALNDDYDDDNFEKQLADYQKGTETAQGKNWGAKAKTNSSNINRAAQSLAHNGSLLVVISQTKDLIGSTIPGLKTRSGGRSLKFFSHVEVWTSIRKPITRRYLGKEREVGATIKVDVQKNRVSGWEGKFELDFVKTFGIDDLGSCVKYLGEERYWEVEGKEEAKEYTAKEFGVTGTVDEVVRAIERAGEEEELYRLTALHWNKIIEQSTPDRKPRYT